MIRPLLLPILWFSLIQSAVATESTERLQRLRDVMTERLAIMEQVARFKWNEGLPVEDKDREAAVLEKTVGLAVAEGLNTKVATRVIKAQIEAAKFVQRALFEKWRAMAKGKLADAPNLTVTLRPEISRLSNDLIAALIAAEDDLDDCFARRILIPLPEALTPFPRAWDAAVDGTLGAAGSCP